MSSSAPKSTPARKKSSLSVSQGGPSQPAPKRAVAEVLTISDSDDDAILTEISFGPVTKKVKTEPQPTAPAVKLASIFTKLQPQPKHSPAPAVPSRPESASSRSKPTRSVQEWRFDPSQPRQGSPTDGSSGPSHSGLRSSAPAGSRLLARNLLAKQQTSYLQQEHYLAPNGEEIIGGGPAAGAAGSDDDEPATDSEEEAAPKPSKRAKGKSKAATPDSPPPPGASRLARFALQPSTTSKSSATASASGVKYTPLEQQVLALQARHPGVVLMIEVGYKMKVSRGGVCPLRPADHRLYSSSAITTHRWLRACSASPAFHPNLCLLPRSRSTA